eukprot:SAG31_NODE_1075_length_10048_cov_21.627701_2_plen_238_part_00
MLLNIPPPEKGWPHPTVPKAVIIHIDRCLGICVLAKTAHVASWRRAREVCASKQLELPREFDEFAVVKRAVAILLLLLLVVVDRAAARLLAVVVVEVHPAHAVRYGQGDTLSISPGFLGAQMGEVRIKVEKVTVLTLSFGPRYGAVAVSVEALLQPLMGAVAAIDDHEIKLRKRVVGAGTAIVLRGDKFSISPGFLGAHMGDSARKVPQKERESNGPYHILVHAARVRGRAAAQTED